MNSPSTIRTTVICNAAGILLYCGELFEKDLYKKDMPQVLGEELQLAQPLSPSSEAIVQTPAAAKMQRGPNLLP